MQKIGERILYFLMCGVYMYENDNFDSVSKSSLPNSVACVQPEVRSQRTFTACYGQYNNSRFYFQAEEIHQQQSSDLQDLLEAARKKAAVEQSRAHR